MYAKVRKIYARQADASAFSSVSGATAPFMTVSEGPLPPSSLVAGAVSP